eukprot:gene7226-5078_t
MKIRRKKTLVHAAFLFLRHVIESLLFLGGGAQTLLILTVLNLLIVHPSFGFWILVQLGSVTEICSVLRDAP